MTRLDAAAAFYLVPFRVFQFAAGALISFVPVAPGAGSRPLAVGLTVAGVLGLGTLAVSVTVLDADRVSYPGIWALLPTAGTVLVLLATTGFRHDRSSLLRAPLESVPLVFLGRISYSLYLVHWPVVALYRYRYGPPEGLALPALATLMLLLALLLHSQVERRFYRRAGEPGAASGHRAGGPGLPQTAMGIGLLLVASGAVLASAWAGDGWAWRRPGLRLDPATIEAGMQRRYAHLGEACRLAAFRDGPCGEPYDRRVLVLGNSLEPDGYNFLRAATGNPPGLQFVLFGTTNRCAELRVAEGVPLSSTAECQQRLDRLFSPQFLNTLDAVFYASNRPYAPNKAPVLDLLRELKRRRPALAVGTLGGYINTVRDCSYYMSEYGMPDACLEPSRVRVFVADRTTRPLYAAFRELEDLYVDRVGLLCEERKLQNCAYATREGVPMMYDRVHSSLEFAEFTGSLYRRRHGDALLQGLGLAGG